MLFALVIVAGLLLAYANGANDNFKGVATLFGSRTTDYRQALFWGTAMTAVGSIVALLLATELLKAFTGKGLVTPEVLANPIFPVAVALAAGCTVLLATKTGFPISTTHALIGALVGSGLVLSGGGINGGRLLSGFALPLLVSPFLSIGMAIGLYPVLRGLRRKLGIKKETCVCIAQKTVAVLPGEVGTTQALRSIQVPEINLGDDVTCEVKYNGRIAGLSAAKALDVAHFISAGSVSFARGVNDTPKIAALLLIGEALSPFVSIALVAVAIAVGGLASARRVALTMSKDVTEMNAGQGFTANIVTAFLVIVASRLGMPVSTTHVSCGSLFGIGYVTRQAHWKTIGTILLAWVTTLPLAAILGGGLVFAFSLV